MVCGILTGISPGQCGIPVRKGTEMSIHIFSSFEHISRTRPNSLPQTFETSPACNGIF
jgi:hypothetical protein